MNAIEIDKARTPEVAQALTTLPFSKAVVSKDGTSIAFDRIGRGVPVILVDGALCYRGMGQSGGWQNSWRRTLP